MYYAVILNICAYLGTYNKYMYESSLTAAYLGANYKYRQLRGRPGLLWDYAVGPHGEEAASTECRVSGMEGGSYAR